MASCNSWQYLVTILAKNFPRSWQDLAKILLRYPWRVDPGSAVTNEQNDKEKSIDRFSRLELCQSLALMSQQKG